MDSIVPSSAPQRQCISCLEIKPFTDFYPANSNSDGVTHVCKGCRGMIQQKKIPGIHEVRRQERANIAAQKRCQTCKELLDLTPENFFYRKKSPDGFRGQCKKCHKLKAAQAYRRLHPKPDKSQKRCNGPCGQLLPATTEYFHKRLEGLTPWCKSCTNARNKANYVSWVKPKPDVKTCTQCGELLPFTEEYFYPSMYYKKYGLMAHCKECHGKWRIEHRQTHREAYHERERAYYKRGVQQAYVKSHPEQYRQYARKSYLLHREERRSTRRKRDLLHREELRQYHRQYRETHREQIYAYQRQYGQRSYVIAYRNEWSRNKRARAREIAGTHTAAQIAEQLKRQHYHCYYAACGFAKLKKDKTKAFGFDCHIEHTYPISRIAGTDIPGNGISYLVLACPSCNLSKGKLFPWEWAPGGRLL